MLRKFDTSPKKEIKIIKTQENAKKIYVNIKYHSLL